MVHYRYPESELDASVHAIQNELHKHLLCMWDLIEPQYNCFGRVYRNPKPTGNGFIPEVYTKDGEYKDTLLDDRFAVVSFFGMGDYSEVGGQNVADAHFIFFVNLTRIKFQDRNGEPVVLSGRGDLEARNAVQAVLNQNLYGFVVSGVQTGPQALREYDIQRPGTNSTNLNRWDMHPWHVFRVNGTMSWSKPNLSNFDQNN